MKRRTLIKDIAITPLWTTPIVSSICMPVHAQTSVLANGVQLVSKQLMCENDNRSMFTIVLAQALYVFENNSGIDIQIDSGIGRFFFDGSNTSQTTSFAVQTVEPVDEFSFNTTPLPVIAPSGNRFSISVEVTAGTDDPSEPATGQELERITQCRSENFEANLTLQTADGVISVER